MASLGKAPAAERRHDASLEGERQPLLSPSPCVTTEQLRDSPPVFFAVRSSKAFITFVVSFAVFVDSTIFAIIVPITPFYLPDVIGVPKEDVQYWTSVLIAVYSVGCFAVSPVWGWYTDRSPSRKGPLLLGILMLLAATATLWLGSSLPLQVIGRLFQGTAAAMVWITGLALIVDTVGSKESGHYMGYVAVAMMVGSLVGPMIGGILYAKLGYDAVFGVIISMIVGDLVLRYAAIDRNTALETARAYTAEETTSQRNSSTTDNHRSSATLDQNTEPRTTARAQREADAPPLSPTPTPTIPPLPAPRSTGRPRLPAIVTLLGSGRLLAALWGTLVSLGLLSGLEATLPLHTAAAFGWRSVGGGLAFVPLTLPAFLGPAVGWLSDRHGARWPTAGGFALLCPALALLRVVARDTLAHQALLGALLALAGLGYTLTINPLTAEVAYVVESRSVRDGLGADAHSAEDGHGGRGRDMADAGELVGAEEQDKGAATVYAQAYALFNMAASLGGIAGPLCAGLVRDAAGWPAMTSVLAAASATGVLVAGLWTGGWIGESNGRQQQRLLDDEECTST